jgi:general secretion pathway protein A
VDTNGTEEKQSAPEPAAGSGLLTYERAYGLSDKPFSLSTRPVSLYRSEAHAPVFDDLLTAIQRREGLVVLTGDIGTGKTTLCRSVLASLDRKTFTTFVPDPFVTREDLLKMLLVDFGVVSVDDLVRGRLKGASRPDLSYPLYDFLRSLEPIEAFAVLIIDEAQRLPPALLEEIRILSDLEDRRKLLQVVLIGQPELREVLHLPHMRQVQQRVSMHCQLQPLSRDGVAGYVAHRLAVAGGRPDRVTFTAEAIDRVYAASGGVPRLINLICDRALHHGALRAVAAIGPDLVAVAAADLHLTTAAGPSAVVGGRERPSLPTAPAPAAGGPPAADRAPASERAAFEASAAAPADARSRSGGGSELDALLGMVPTSARAPLSKGAARARAAAPAGDAEAFVPPHLAMSESSGRRVPLLVVIALTVLGVLAGGSLAVYVLWMRPLLRTEVAHPPVAAGKRSAVEGAATPGVPALAVVPESPGADAGAPSASSPVGSVLSGEHTATPVPALVGVPEMTAATEAGDGWAVQVGAFANPRRAEALRTSLVFSNGSSSGVLTVSSK